MHHRTNPATDAKNTPCGAVGAILPDTHEPPELVTEPEAARALGVSAGTLKAARLHRLQSNPLRDLPHVKIGRSVRYRRADIARWIEAHTVRPAADPHQHITA